MLRSSNSIAYGAKAVSILIHRIAACEIWSCLPLIILIVAGCDWRGAATEELRSWVRNDPQRQKLIVFVHGFRSSKDAAWGKLPDLIMGDAEFDEFNIHLFGYPTQTCRQVGDIRDEGEYLASFLREIAPNYESITFVGHSMGGLVILHALLALESYDHSLLKNVGAKVMTFGTPYLGVEGAELLSLLCENNQVNDMFVLNKELGRLTEDWRRRFNGARSTESDGRLTVPVLAFRGIKDNFVSQTSACGGPVTSCEVVDGDHISIVKPLTREHLAYQKIKGLVKKPQVPPTAGDRIGIWVSRIVGDHDSNRGQHTLMHRLEFYILKDESLRDVVEVRELPNLILGETFHEREQEAKRLGKTYNASIVVSGQIGGLFKPDEFEPSVTLVKDFPGLLKSMPLAPMQESEWHNMLSTPPGTTNLPPQPLNEPLQLARFLAAVTFMGQNNWAEAARRLEESVTSGGPANSLRLADMHFYTGIAFHKEFSRSGKGDTLQKAQEAYLKALSKYKPQEDWRQYVDVKVNLGLTHLEQGRRAKQPEHNFRLARESFEDGANRSKEHQDWKGYARAQDLLGMTFLALAERGIDPRGNQTRAVKTLQQVVKECEERKDWDNYASAQNSLGVMHAILADQEVEPVLNRKRAIQALQQAAARWTELKNWSNVAGVQNNLGAIYIFLAKSGVDSKQNYGLGLNMLENVSQLWKSQKHWNNYAMAENNLGNTCRILAEHGIDPDKNLQCAVGSLIEAARQCEEQRDWPDYAGAQLNLGHTYSALAKRGIESEYYLRCAVTAFKDAARRWKTHNMTTRALGAENQLKQTYRVMAERKVKLAGTLEPTVEACMQTAEQWKERGTGRAIQSR
jgi:tetratricopeptide (TPR) repeat protein